MDQDGSPAALDGVRVLDLAGPPGQYAGKLLADLGADVVRIEPPGGSSARNHPPFVDDVPNPNRSIPFWCWNTNKRSVCLDIARADGRALFQRLLPRYDVLIHTFTTDEAARLGLDHATLAALDPAIVTCSITPFGDWGPHAAWQADDMVVAAMSGLMTLAGYPDRAPVMPPGAQAMVCGSIQAAQGILIALLARDASGRGQHVEVSQQEAMAITQETAMQFWDMRGELRRRRGDERPVPGSGTYACADGYIYALAGGGLTGAGLPVLVRWMDEEGMAGDLTRLVWQETLAGMNTRALSALAAEPEKLQEMTPRLTHVEALLVAFFRSKTKLELYLGGQRRRLLIAPVNSPRDIRENEHLRARGWWQAVEHTELGRSVNYPGAPYRHSETPWRIQRRPPLLGEHTLEVLEGELGLTRGQSQILTDLGVIQMTATDEAVSRQPSAISPPAEATGNRQQVTGPAASPTGSIGARSIAPAVGQDAGAWASPAPQPSPAGEREEVAPERPVAFPTKKEEDVVGARLIAPAPQQGTGPRDADPTPDTRHSTPAATTLPLQGIRVADFSWFGAGPIAGQTLRSFGAEVIRVESQARLDGLRRAQPVPPGKEGSPNVSGYYNNFNAGKQSFSLNLGQRGARAVALDLLATCDVMLENYTPHVVEQWGLTYDEVVKVRPDIIYAQMPMQGSSGPQRDFLGFGAIIAPVAGYSHLSGWPDRPPTGMGTNYPDFVINPGHAVIAILAALRYRSRTGKGQRIELAQVESVAATLGPALLEHSVSGRVPQRAGNRVAAACPHGAFRCLDGGPLPPAPAAPGLPPSQPAPTNEDRWIAIAVSTDAHWQSLLDLMGRPAWSCDERFQTLLGRKHYEDELEQHIEAWTRTLSAEDAMERLQAHGVPAGIVQTARDTLERDEHLAARGYYQYLDHAETGRSAYDGPGFRLSEVPYGLQGPAPLIGEHNDQVLRELLGYDGERITALLLEQVVY